MHPIFEIYNNKPLIYGKFDCALMLLKFTNFDTTVFTYKTFRGAKTQLPNKTGFNTHQEYLNAHGYKRKDYRLVSDFDVLLHGIHVCIYFDGHIFGYSDLTEKFQFTKVSISDLTDFEVYSHG